MGTVKIASVEVSCKPVAGKCPAGSKSGGISGILEPNSSRHPALPGTSDFV